MKGLWKCQRGTQRKEKAIENFFVIRSVFRTQSTIYDGAYLRKKLHHRCLTGF